MRSKKKQFITYKVSSIILWQIIHFSILLHGTQNINVQFNPLLASSKNRLILWIFRKAPSFSGASNYHYFCAKIPLNCVDWADVS